MATRKCFCHLATADDGADTRQGLPQVRNWKNGLS